MDRPRRLLPLFAVLATLIGLLIVAGCGEEDSSRPHVRLGRRVELAGVRQMPDRSLLRDGLKAPLRVAIASIISPAMTLESYHDLLAYIGRRLGRPVELVQRRTYAEVNDLIQSRQIDLAFVCTLAYTEGEKEFRLEFLVAPQIRGRVVYFSYLIVPDDSRANNLSDLKGKTFAFSDPLSNSGRLAPTYQLALMGETPDAFFGRYVFTYSHDNSIVAVADRLVDGAAVDSLVYDFLAAKNPDLVAKTKVIARWGPFGIPPVVVSPRLDPDLKRTLKDLFLSIHKDDDGKRILETLMIDRFVEVGDEQYNFDPADGREGEKGPWGVTDSGRCSGPSPGPSASGRRSWGSSPA